MSWTIEGAKRMAKILQLRGNREIKRYINYQRSLKEKKDSYKEGSQNFCREEYGEWLRVNVPVLNTSYPWVQTLRNLIDGSFPQN